jgi:kynurenine formamidase
MTVKKFIDLSLPIEETPSERVPVRIRYLRHDEGALEMQQVLGVAAADLPDGTGWAGEELRLISHAGTHMDAPWHYGPFSQGSPARTIDQVPLEWCCGPGVVLDFRQKAHDSEITVDDIISALSRAGHILQEGDVVLIWTGADQWWGTEDYPDKGCGLGRDATLWLVQRGIRVIGTDAWGLDQPFAVMRRQYAQNHDVSHIWPAHFAGREVEYCQLEKLTNLHLLPSDGFTVICFPVKIAKASAGWTRAVAVLEQS